MRAIAYIRVSTEEQARDGASVTAQRAALARYADANGLQIVQTCEDLGVSARTPFESRPGGAQAFAAFAAKRADVLLVTAVDRWVRDVREGLAFVDWCRPRRIRILSLRESIDASTASGRFALTVLLGTVELERNVIAERTEQAMQQMRRDGRCVGTVPYGTVRVDAQRRRAPRGEFLAREPATWERRERVVELYRYGLPDGREVGFGNLARWIALHSDDPTLYAPGGSRWWSKASLKSLHDTHDFLSQLPLAEEIATEAAT
jgi:site-specific DNA recombinase